MKIALYPGSFDPVTNGHLDILKRALTIFDKFSVQERVIMLKESTRQFENVEIISTDDLVVKKAKELKANAVVRGLRAVTDFEFEFQLAAANNFIDPDIEMVFLMSSPGLGFISSSSIKEMSMHSVDISSLVPPVVLSYLKKK